MISWHRLPNISFDWKIIPFYFVYIQLVKLENPYIEKILQKFSSDLIKTKEEY